MLFLNINFVLLILNLFPIYYQCQTLLQTNGIKIDKGFIEITNLNRNGEPKLKFTLSTVTVDQVAEENSYESLSLTLSDQTTVSILSHETANGTNYNFFWPYNAQAEKREICFYYALNDAYWYEAFNENDNYFTCPYSWPIDSSMSVDNHLSISRTLLRQTNILFSEFLLLNTDGFGFLPNIENQFSIFRRGKRDQDPVMCLYVKPNYSEKDCKCTLDKNPTADFEFDIFTSVNIKILSDNIRTNYLKIPSGIPNENIFKYPTWLFASGPSLVHEDLISFAKLVKQHGFENSEIQTNRFMVDLTDLNFELHKENVKALTNQVHSLGLRFGFTFCLQEINPRKGSEVYFLKKLNTPSSFINFDDKNSVKWLTDNLNQVYKDYNIDGQVHIDFTRLYYSDFSSILPNIINYHRKFLEALSIVNFPISFSSEIRTQHLRVFTDLHVELDKLVPVLLGTSIAGYSFVNIPITKSNSAEEYIRNVQAHAFLPAISFHYPPWNYDNATVNLTQQFVNLHSAYASIIIELIKKMSQSGSPTYRPMWYAEPDDKRTYKIDNQFMVGDDIVVAPVVKYGERQRKIYLPSGIWIDQNGKKYNGPSEFKVSAPIEELPYFTRKSFSRPTIIDRPITSKPATPEPITPKANTSEPIIPTPVTPEPITPKANTSEPIIPTPVTPEPITPKANTSEPITPKPATPGPITPKANTSEPIAPKTATPEPTTTTPATRDPITPIPTTLTSTTKQNTTIMAKLKQKVEKSPLLMYLKSGELSDEKSTATKMPLEPIEPVATKLAPIEMKTTLIEKLEKLTNESLLSSNPLTEREWIEAIDNLADIITDFSHQNLPWNKTFEVADITFATINHMIETPKLWNNFSHNEQINQASKFLTMIEQLSTKLNAEQQNCHHENFIIVNQNYSSLLVKSTKFPVSNPNASIKFGFDSQLAFELNIQAFNGTQIDPFKSGKNIVATVVIVDKLPHYMSLSKNGLLLNSKLISVNAGQSNETIHLKPPYKFKFTSKNVHKLEFHDQPKCLYWDFTFNSWSPIGCSYNRAESNRSFTVCECDHLTNFAALLDVSHREVPSVAKSYLTYVCSSLNCVFIFGAIYVALKHNNNNQKVHLWFDHDPDKRLSNQHLLTLNIAFCLLFSHLSILFGMDLTQCPLVCGLNSITLLFTLLCTFTFMFLFSFHNLMHCSSRYVTDFKYYAVVGYMTPMVIIITSICVIYFTKTHNVIQSLTGKYFCWISSRKYPEHIWIFAIPATLLWAINFAILIYLLAKFFEYRSLKTIQKAKLSSEFSAKMRNRIKREREKRLTKVKEPTISDETKRLFLNSYFLVFNFGLPWILYVLYINEYFRHFSYAFIVVNATQGIPLFVEQIYIYRRMQSKEQKLSKN